MKQLWFGGKIYTMENESDTVEAVLVEDGSILKTGSFNTLKKDAETLYDLQGAVMYPGFVDSHLHMIHHGEKLIRLDLSTASSVDEMLQMISDEAQKIPDDQWLFGDAWNENQFPDQRIPTMEELNAIRKAPILLTRVCRHVVLGNSSAFSFGGISENTVAPVGGEIGRDSSGNLNGLLYEEARTLITNKLPKTGNEYIQTLTKTLRLSIKEMVAYGLTGGHTEDMSYFGHFTNPLQAFQQVVNDEFPFRIHLLRHHAVFQEMVEQNLQLDERFIESGAMKIFLDGALGGSTAALSIPYTDQPNSKGLFIHTDEELKRLVKLARANNEAVAIHMIGDAAVEQALNIIEQYPAPSKKRDRFIHCSILRDDLIERIKNLPIVVDAQPAFVPSDFPWIKNRLGEERLHYAYPWRTLLDLGIICAAGTDAPVEHIDPLLTIYAAVERKAPSDQHNGYISKEKISRFEAVQMYTLGSAQASGKEGTRGMIKQGYDADFSIFDRDLFAGPTEDLLKTKAIKTVIAGKIVFDRLNAKKVVHKE